VVRLALVVLGILLTLSTGFNGYLYSQFVQVFQDNETIQVTTYSLARKNLSKAGLRFTGAVDEEGATRQAFLQNGYDLVLAYQAGTWALREPFPQTTSDFLYAIGDALINAVDDARADGHVEAEELEAFGEVTRIVAQAMGELENDKILETEGSLLIQTIRKRLVEANLWSLLTESNISLREMR